MSCRYFGFCESEGLFVVLVLGVLEVSSPASIDAPAPTEPDCEVLEPMLPLLLELVPIPLFGEELVDEPVVDSEPNRGKKDRGTRDHPDHHRQGHFQEMAKEAKPRGGVPVAS